MTESAAARDRAVILRKGEMRFGLFHSVQWPEGTNQLDRFDEAIDQALYAEAIGMDAIWLTEHHFTRHGLIADATGILHHIAARTERVRLGTAVSVLPFHNPLRLAESIATLDVLSRGRVNFGVCRWRRVPRVLMRRWI